MDKQAQSVFSLSIGGNKCPTALLAERRCSLDLFSQGTSVMPASQLDSAGKNWFCVFSTSAIALLVLRYNPLNLTSQR